VVSKMQSLPWLENLKRSQRLTAREERRKEEIMEIFHELHDISLRYQDPPPLPAVAPVLVRCRRRGTHPVRSE
jgi:hypothetical protein